MAYCVPLGLAHSKFLSWDENDQDKALAYRRWERERCVDCGTSLKEWEKNRFAYVGDTWRCPGCEILDMERDMVPKKEKGIRIGLRKN